MKENYSYPIDPDWSTEELIAVMEMWQAVEEVYEKGMDLAEFKQVYQQFKQVIRSIGEEKKLGKEFESISGYSLYRTVQAAKANSTKILKMKEANPNGTKR